MKKIYVLLLLIFAVTVINAQTFYQNNISLKKLPLAWSGGAPYIVKQTADSGFIFCGLYNAGSTNNIFFIKMDKTSTTQWSFGLTIANTPIPYALIQSKDGGFVLVGSYADGASSTAAFVLKLNSSGTLLWQKFLKGQALTSAYSVSEDNMGNVFVAGKSDAGSGGASYCWTTQIAKNGTILLNKVYQLTGYDTYETQVLSTTAKGFAIIGTAGTNSFVMKVDSLGVPTWTKLINEDLTAFRMDISESKNKELTIAASRSTDALAFKLDKKGNIKWSKSIAGSGGVDVNDLVQLSSGNFILATVVSGSPNEINVLRLDNTTGGLLAAKNLKTTTGSTFNFLSKPMGTEYTLSGWDASAGTNYISVSNLDTSLQNCTDNAASFTVADYTFTSSTITSTTLSPLTEPVATFSRVSWVNPATVDTACSEIILPLNLIRFTLAKNGNSNLLSWSTAQEINTSYFEVQRGINNTSFAAIGKVLAANKQTQNNYQFADIKPLNGTNYYRLKIVDADGKFTYSPILISSNNKLTDIAVYPNPVKDRIVLNINSKVKTTFNVTVTDMQGRTILRNVISVDEGISQRELNATALKQGTYFVRLENTDGSQIIKIIK
ncbi:T9SS type A sorting domain-containing protein [Panacibacter ginsenosidivorans]|uniref:T9SS type A sorting domain-containing protein n=1 Tax=Panacibacter ginsenosidivorans TaxID=1813871 RepID=A0A5B8V7B4_9BACT|nr:T9SS type A sorting domain-containing protein [Panacibacter ginsenosidivorans]QEC67035.1 T9SS type A sorting domain-containing protein [Panacibacter ginsenosidivorans]